MLIDTQRVDESLDPGFFLYLSTVVVLKALLQQPFEVWQPPHVPSGDRPQLVLLHSPPDLGGGAVPDGQPGGLLHHPDVGPGCCPQVTASQEHHGPDLWAGQLGQFLST